MPDLGKVLKITAAPHESAVLLRVQSEDRSMRGKMVSEDGLFILFGQMQAVVPGDMEGVGQRSRIKADLAQHGADVFDQMVIEVALGDRDFERIPVLADQNAERLEGARQDGGIVLHERLHAGRQLELADVGQDEAVASDVVARLLAHHLLLLVDRHVQLV